VRLKSTTLIPFVVLLSTVVACSAGSSEDVDTTTSIATTTTTTLAPAVLAFPYFEEIAKDSRVGYEAAAELSTSVAREYALYQNEYVQALTFAIADGEKFEDEPLKTARADDAGRILLESTDDRITYSDFKFTGGKISDFSVEGRLLSGNLRSGIVIYNCLTYDGNCESDGSFDVQILHAYVSAKGDMLVTYSARIGSKYQRSVREDRASGGLPNHVLVDSAGQEISASGAIETFAKGETRVNVVSFGPLTGGGTYTLDLRFRSGGSLREFDGIVLGNFQG